MAEAEIDGTPRALPIAKAAREVVVFEKATVLLERGEIALGQSLSDHRSARSYGPVKASATIRNFVLCDVVLDADSLVLLKDGKVIPETCYFLPDGFQDSIRVRHDSLARLADTEGLVLACNRACGDYYHWMTQCLPAIDWSLRHRRHEKPRLALPPLEPWQEDTLALLGYAEVPRLVLQTGAQYLIPDAEYSEFLNGSTSFKLSRCLVGTAAQLAAAVAPGRAAHRIIYVPCTNPYYGQVDNEPELVDFLRKRGVHIFSRDAMTTAERIDLFRHADVVIGLHGEGLTDILFCKPGSLLWELIPPQLQNTCFNRLAQSAGVDYWGDLFGPGESGLPGDWHIDLDVVAQRLDSVPSRPAAAPNRSALSLPGTGTTHAKPLDELMMQFESLGDNCEFGLVQREANSEPLGLLRFASMFAPEALRIGRLVYALDNGFAGLGSPWTIGLTVEGANREYIIGDTAYDLVYHTFRHEQDMTVQALLDSEGRRLGFLRRKLLDDLKSGEKIWVWKSRATTAQKQVIPLLEALRRHGPNTLLWIVEADQEHSSGMVERLGDDLLKGYVARFAPAADANDIEPEPWFEMCQRAYDLWIDSC